MTSLVDAVRRRASGDFVVDEWGLDHDLFSVVDPVLGLRWRVDVGGADHVPVDGPALLVANRRVGVSEPLVLARGIHATTGRFARFLGVPDVAPVGPFLRRLGGALDRPDEMRGLLRAGEVVVAPLEPVLRTRLRAGALHPEALAPALELRVPVIPVAVMGHEAGWRWRVVVGKPVPPPAAGGPLAVAELAEEARNGVQHLLDDAFPPRWPFG